MKKIIAIPVMCSVVLTGCGQADIPDNTPDTQIVIRMKAERSYLNTISHDLENELM